MQRPSHDFNKLRAEGRGEKKKKGCESKVLHSCLVMSVFMVSLYHTELSTLIQSVKDLYWGRTAIFKDL